MSLCFDTDKNKCSSNPCQNNGTCTYVQTKVGEWTYECQCSDQFTGTSCESKLDNEYLLLNSSNSISLRSILLIGNFIIHSVKVKNPCDPDPCQNKAQCFKLDDTRFYCDCSQLPYHGDLCQYSK